MKLHLTLEKGGVIKLESIELSKILSLLDYAKTITQYIEENWKLKDVKCKNKEVEKFFRNLINQYQADPKFKVSVKDTVKMGLKIAKKHFIYDYKTWKEEIEKIEKELMKI